MTTQSQTPLQKETIQISETGKTRPNFIRMSLYGMSENMNGLSFGVYDCLDVKRKSFVYILRNADINIYDRLFLSLWILASFT